MRRVCLFILALGLSARVTQARADDAQEAYKLGVKANEGMAKKQYDEALKLTEKAIRLEPKNPSYHGFAGFAHWHLKQYPAGLTACETAVRLAGGKNDAWYLHMAGENAYGTQDFP